MEDWSTARRCGFIFISQCRSVATTAAPSFSDVPFEILLALPYLAVIVGLAVSGRNVPYPGAYLKPYKRH